MAVYYNGVKVIESTPNYAGASDAKEVLFASNAGLTSTTSTTVTIPADGVVYGSYAPSSSASNPSASTFSVNNVDLFYLKAQPGIPVPFTILVRQNDALTVTTDANYDSTDATNCKFVPFT